MKDLSNENIIHISHNGVNYIQFKRLLEYKDKIKHCYTLKDLDFKLKDKHAEDYKCISSELGFDCEQIVHPTQTHSCNVEVVEENSKSCDFDDVDGLITNVSNKVLSLHYADCTAILLYDPVSNAIGNIHSGWRGTVKKIGKIAVEKMVKEYKTDSKNLIACIAPTIRKCHFEVVDDVKNIFEEVFKDSSIITVGDIKDGKQKYFVDTVKANTNMLLDCGLELKNIIDSGICTVCNSDVLHSFRAEKQNAGRNEAIISII